MEKFWKVSRLRMVCVWGGGGSIAPLESQALLNMLYIPGTVCTSAK